MKNLLYQLFTCYAYQEKKRKKKKKKNSKITRGTNISMAATVFPSSFCLIQNALISWKFKLNNLNKKNYMEFKYQHQFLIPGNWERKIGTCLWIISDYYRTSSKCHFSYKAFVLTLQITSPLHLKIDSEEIFRIQQISIVKVTETNYDIKQLIIYK